MSVRVQLGEDLFCIFFIPLLKISSSSASLGKHGVQMSYLYWQKK